MGAKCRDEHCRAKLLLRLLLRQTDKAIVLLFDNLESVQDPTSLELTDEDTRAWVQAAEQLCGPKLTLLLTSRWSLPGWPQADHWPLEHLGYNDYLQLARQQRLPADFLQNRDRMRILHNTLHGNARGLEFFASAIQVMTLNEEQAFLEKLAHAGAEVQTNMALEKIYTHRNEQEQELLTRLTAYQTAVPIEGIIKIALDLESPERLLTQLQAVSLVERHYSQAWQCHEYEVPATVTEWLSTQSHGLPASPWLQAAADYHMYLFRRERRTLKQAILAHNALRQADDRKRADRLVLDFIIGPLNRRGLYQTILNDWLPPIRESEVTKTRAEAIGQTGNQYFHIGDYDTALQYLKQSLAITQEIGDAAGLCATLFNMGHIHLQNEEVPEAINAWINVYLIAKPMQLAQALEALESLAEQLGLPGGLQGWEMLAQQRDNEQT
jgi:tetratricopeptide (TPR) repeat protein